MRLTKAIKSTLRHLVESGTTPRARSVREYDRLCWLRRQGWVGYLVPLGWYPTVRGNMAATAMDFDARERRAIHALAAAGGPVGERDVRGVGEATWEFLSDCWISTRCDGRSTMTEFGRNMAVALRQVEEAERPTGHREPQQ